MADSSRANGGFRPDLTQAVTALHPPVLRWQAGNWKNGIGPQSKRLGDDASFGVDEFLAFARKVGAEPLIVVPVDRPEYLQDALDLFAYCTGPPDSAWGRSAHRTGTPSRTASNIGRLATRSQLRPPRAAPGCSVSSCP